MPRRPRPLRVGVVQPDRGLADRSPVSGDPELLADGSVHLTALQLPRSASGVRQPLRPSRVGPRQDEDPDSGGRRQAGAEARRADVDSPAKVASPPTVPMAPWRRDRASRVAGSRRADPGRAPLRRRLPTMAARATVAPLSPDRYRLQVTIGGDTLETLRCAQDMLGHAIPSGDEAAVLDRGQTSSWSSWRRRSSPTTPKPGRHGGRSAGTFCRRPTRGLGGTSDVALRRAGGHRCNERRFIEFHHLDPKALGGEATVDTIELRCRRHNDYEGRLWFGKRAVPELVPEQVRSSAYRR